MKLLHSSKLLLPSFFISKCLSSAILFEHGTIISYNEAAQDFEILKDASMLIEDDRITRLVNGTDDCECPPDVMVIDATDKIISPGFVNTHHHLWQTAYKTLASNTTLAEYFQRYSEFSPAIKNFSPEDTYLGQLAGALELLHEGTTTVLDHAHGDFSDDHANAALNATFDSGIRSFHAHSVHPLPNGYSTDEQIRLFDTWKNDPRLRNSSSVVELGLSYDFFSSAPEANISALWKTVQDNNLSVVTTHYLGGPWTYGNSPELLNSYGWLNDSVPVVFSHASFATQTDYALLRSTDQYLSTTPESEQHYGHGHVWSHLIQDQAALGVDTHFTYSASMVQQARTWMQSLREHNFVQVLTEDYAIPRNSPMSVKQAFSLATRAGGLALRRGGDLGVIREGAKADVVVFDGNSPNMLGWGDPIAAVILHSNVGDIEHVLVDGNFVKRNRSLVYPDYDGLVRKFKKSAARIQNIWLNTDFEPLEGYWAGNISLFEDTKVIDTLRGDGTGY